MIVLLSHVLPVFFILGGEFQQDNSFHLPRFLFSPCYPALPEAILFSDSPNFSPQSPLLFPAADRSCTCSSSIWLVLSPGAQKLKPFQGWEATNRRGFGAQSFCIQSRGERVARFSASKVGRFCLFSLTEIACFVWESQILSTDSGLKSVSESTNKISIG